MRGHDSWPPGTAGGTGGRARGPYAGRTGPPGAGAGYRVPGAVARYSARCALCAIARHSELRRGLAPQAGPTCPAERVAAPRLTRNGTNSTQPGSRWGGL